jgi:murein DD-endopeptidase MepM/ murein hydrolase activator NlpD
MNRKLLESITNRGYLLATWWSHPELFDHELFLTQIQALCGERPGLLVDLGGWLRTSPSQMDCGSLFARHIQWQQEVPLPQWNGFSVLSSSGLPYACDTSSIRKFLTNLQSARAVFPYIVLLLPRQWQAFMGPALASVSLAVCSARDLDAAGELAAPLEQLPNPESFSIWWNGPRPSIQSFPHLAKGQQAWNSVATTESTPLLWQDLVRIHILLRNPPEGWLYNISRWGWVAVVLLCLLPFFPTHKLGHPITGLRSLTEDKVRFSEASYIAYEFNGQESIQRIARYAIGRYRAIVTQEAMVARYVKETLTRNSLNDSGWQRTDVLVMPPAGTTIRFYPPESIQNPRQEATAPAWRYFTGILSDSIAYLTEFYHVNGSDEQRKHDGIDIGGRMGARILAPFSAKAWASRDERGGVIIGLVRGEDVMLFMHCDQLLYLDGQDVMEGDPIATVGMTGHTTGPHVHLASGLVSKTGQRSIGPVRYNPLDPIEWYRIQARRKMQESLSLKSSAHVATEKSSSSAVKISPQKSSSSSTSPAPRPSRS